MARLLPHRLEKLERARGARPCVACSKMPNYRILRSFDEYDPAWSRCRVCGRKLVFKIVVLPDGDH
jgi:hypothetical protein